MEGSIRQVAPHFHISLHAPISYVTCPHYLRLGQEPPPQPVEDVFDGRSLAEVGLFAALLSSSCSFVPYAAL